MKVLEDNYVIEDSIGSISSDKKELSDLPELLPRPTPGECVTNIEYTETFQRMLPNEDTPEEMIAQFLESYFSKFTGKHNIQSLCKILITGIFSSLVVGDLLEQDFLGFFSSILSKTCFQLS